MNTKSMKIVKKSDEKKKPVVEKKILETPINDTESFKDVEVDQIRVQAPMDGSIPTWRGANGKVQTMVAVRLADGSVEFRVRKKKGPAQGKKYRPRAKKIAQLMEIGGVNSTFEMQEANETEQVAMLMNQMQQEYQKLMALRSLMN